MANVVKRFTLYLAEAYSEPCQASQIKLFGKIVNLFQSLTIFVKIFILNVWQGSEFARHTQANEDTSYISVSETLEKPWSHPYNGIKRSVNLANIVFAYRLHVNFLFNQHTFCVEFYSNNLFLNFNQRNIHKEIISVF